MGVDYFEQKKEGRPFRDHPPREMTPGAPSSPKGDDVENRRGTRLMRRWEKFFEELQSGGKFIEEGQKTEVHSTPERASFSHNEWAGFGRGHLTERKGKRGFRGG